MSRSNKPHNKYLLCTLRNREGHWICECVTFSSNSHYSHGHNVSSFHSPLTTQECCLDILEWACLYLNSLILGCYWKSCLLHWFSKAEHQKQYQIILVTHFVVRRSCNSITTVLQSGLRFPKFVTSISCPVNMTCQVSIWAIYLHFRGSHSFLGSWTNQMTFLPKCTFTLDQKCVFNLSYVFFGSTNRVQGNQRVLAVINGYKSVYYGQHVRSSIWTAIHAS